MRQVWVGGLRAGELASWRAGSSQSSSCSRDALHAPWPHPCYHGPWHGAGTAPGVRSLHLFRLSGLYRSLRVTKRRRAHSQARHWPDRQLDELITRRLSPLRLLSSFYPLSRPESSLLPPPLMLLVCRFCLLVLYSSIIDHSSSFHTYPYISSSQLLVNHHRPLILVETL